MITTQKNLVSRFYHILHEKRKTVLNDIIVKSISFCVLCYENTRNNYDFKMHRASKKNKCFWKFDLLYVLPCKRRSFSATRKNWLQTFRRRYKFTNLNLSIIYNLYLTGLLEWIVQQTNFKKNLKFKIVGYDYIYCISKVLYNYITIHVIKALLKGVTILGPDVIWAHLFYCYTIIYWYTI